MEEAMPAPAYGGTTVNKLSYEGLNKLREFL